MMIKKTLKWTGIVLVGVVALGTLGQMISPNKPASAGLPLLAQPAAPAVVPKVMPEIEKVVLPRYTPADITRAYEDNTVAADLTFKGKRYEISGIVASINTDLFGDPYLTMKASGNEFLAPHFSFGKDALGSLAALKKGSKVVMVCEGRGDVVKIPMNKDCKLL
jgi:tRNA_anti-like